VKCPSGPFVGGDLTGNKEAVTAEDCGHPSPFASFHPLFSLIIPLRHLFFQCLPLTIAQLAASPQPPFHNGEDTDNNAREPRQQPAVTKKKRRKEGNNPEGAQKDVLQDQARPFATPRKRPFFLSRKGFLKIFLHVRFLDIAERPWDARSCPTCWRKML